MQRRRHKERKGTASLINLHQFQKIRQEKEKIMKSPFEENWKKAMVIDELIGLYAGQQLKGRISKSDFNWGQTTKKRQDDYDWDCSQNKQLSKYFNMADGLNRWENTYQKQNISKVVEKIDNRNRNLLRRVPRQTTPQTSLAHSPKNLNSFHKFISKTNHLLAKKQQLHQLEQKAFDQFGIVFSKNQPSIQIDPKVQEFKEKDRNLLEQFLKTIPKQKGQPISQPVSVEDLENYDRIDRRWLLTSPLKDFGVKSRKRQLHRRYIRLS